MIVLVDVGNSRIKWAEREGPALVRRSSVVHRDALDAAFAAFAAALPSATRRIVAANVAGASVAERLQSFATERGIALELVAVTRERLGVRCGYDDPARLGVDRWVGVLAAHALTGGAACVVSAGTAVTFDLVDAAGLHRGGLIWPSARLFAAALERHTSDIGPTAGSGEVPQGADVFGRGTDAAVMHGAWLALAAAIDRAVAIATRELGATPRVLITGGDAAALRAWLETRAEERADLVLEGLGLLAERG
jgi:type III pantothenate kinase